MKTALLSHKALTREAELWYSFAEGHEESFSLLYRKCYRSLLGYGQSLGMSDNQAKDAIQDIFLKIYMRKALIKDASTIRAFLFRSIKNYYLNILKTEQRLTDIQEISSSFHFSYSIEERFIKKEEQEILKKKLEGFLSSLSPRQKEIIYLKFLHEMDYKEIASIMNISEQASRNLMYKALERIRKENAEPVFFILFLIQMYIN
ncbi:MAG: sigma-70 family RNA polymerase sigma factor [Candidatus Azobacteroides sp.]|nr:sigma-70 family RNA polymerase sigma factor [Candidatus Azobacteroides sp.]